MSYHICFLQYDLRGGGAERKVCTLANYFSTLGHQVEIGLYGRNEIAYTLDPRVKVTFICRDNYEYSTRIEEKVYKFKRFLENRVFSLPLIAFDLVRDRMSMNVLPFISAARFREHYRKKHDYTEAILNFFYKRPNAIFITMMVSSYVAIMDVIGNAYGKGIKNQLYVMDCNDPKHNAPGILKDRRDTLYPLATRSIVQTKGAKEYFPVEVQKKMVIIPNPVKEGLPDRYVGIRRKTVVNYCRLNEQKNLSCLIKSFAKFHEVYSDYSLEIYGNGELREELNTLIEMLNLKDCASIREFDPYIHEIIRDAAMFVSSSNWEGFPNSVMEAMAIGMPTISTNCDFGPQELITDHENGILVPVNDVDAMCDAMIELASNPELTEQLSIQAQKIREEYDVRIIGQKWIDLIKEESRERGN